MKKTLIIFLNYGDYPTIARVKNMGKEFISLESITNSRTTLAYCEASRIKASNFKYWLFDYETNDEGLKIVKIWEKLVKLDIKKRKEIDKINDDFKKEMNELLKK